MVAHPGSMGIEGQMNSDRHSSRRFLTLETAKAAAIEAGPITVTPVSRTLTLRCGKAVLTRSWPAAVLVVRESRTSRVRIVNVTRLAGITIIVAAMLCSWGLVAGAARRKGRSR